MCSVLIIETADFYSVSMQLNGLKDQNQKTSAKKNFPAAAHLKVVTQAHTKRTDYKHKKT